MNFTVRVSDEAIQDIDESFIWYDFQQAGLGQIFVLTVDKSFRVIAANPESSVRTFRGLRKYTLPKFPFSIFYKVKKKGSVIEIVRILHHKRDKRKQLFKSLRRR